MADLRQANLCVTATERQRLLQLAFRFCWNRADAEDALHNALVTALDHVHDLRDTQRRWPWLCRIVIRQCHLVGRRRGRDAGALGDPAGCPVADPAPTAAELPEMMRRLLTGLPTQQRHAVTLRHIEQLEYADIAMILGVSPSTARAHVRAGREALRCRIVARYPEWCP